MTSPNAAAAVNACLLAWALQRRLGFVDGYLRRCLGQAAAYRLAWAAAPEMLTDYVREKDGVPTLTLHPFGKGKAAYLGGFAYSPEAARMLLELLLHLTGTDGRAAGITDCPAAECAWFPASHTLVVMNDQDAPGEVTVTLPHKTLQVHLEANGMVFLND